MIKKIPYNILVNILLLLAIGYHFSPGAAYAADFYNGVIITRDGTTIVSPRFLSDHNVDKMPVTLLQDSGNLKTSISKQIIKRIIFSKVKKLPRSGSPPQWKIVDATIFLKDGRKFRAKFLYSSLLSARFFRYMAIDPLSSNQVQQKIAYNNISEIRFGEKYGHLRQDSNGNLFPPDYLYSPYTGEKMEFVVVGNLDK